MENAFQKAQKALLDEDIPDFISLMPKEAYPLSVKGNLQDLSRINISEISKDNNLIEFISDFFSVPEAVDLSQIEKLLSKYPSVTSKFFEEDKIIEKSNANEFQTASKNPNIGEFQTASKNTASSTITPKDKKDCNVDEYILDRISKEILETVINITWDDVVGLENVKKAINEIVLWPMMIPAIFTGLRGSPKGLLLFGSPGTGKTMIGKYIASQCKATFFSISASSLTSKWVGEGEKMVRALFYLARKMSPSVIFIDEIDSLLSQRTDNENEGSRRIKTEFLVQFDGASVDDTDRILIIGATNRPHEIDDAARRRLAKRIYVPLPEFQARKSMI